MKPALYDTALATAPPPIAIKPRSPLPPFDPDSVDADTGAPLPVYTELREAPPAPDVAWWRGDAWGITLPVSSRSSRGRRIRRTSTRSSGCHEHTE
jgi:hypothetical protein